MTMALLGSGLHLKYSNPRHLLMVLLPMVLLKYVDWLHKSKEKVMYKKGSAQISNGLHKTFLPKLSNKNNLDSST